MQHSLCEHTAMGVAKAAGDAMLLRSCLARAPYAEALEEYEHKRMIEGAEIAEYGRRLGANLG
jgi:2-polyprenyl-6-methoxyphenol hydroxylase-like FAD-dependent oxidoreductase